MADQHSLRGQTMVCKVLALDYCADSNSLDEAGGLRELTKDDFWQYMEDAGDKLCVIDFFTDWCATVCQPHHCALRKEPLR